MAALEEVGIVLDSFSLLGYEGMHGGGGGGGGVRV